MPNDIFALPNSQEYHSSKKTLFYHSFKIATLPNLFLDLPNGPQEKSDKYPKDSYKGKHKAKGMKVI
jgi:hypothetical protein